MNPVRRVGIYRGPQVHLRLEQLEARELLSYSITDLGSLGGKITSATDLNERGQVVGESQTGTTTHAFLWDPIKGMQDLGAGSTYSSATGINELGQVIGWSSFPGAPAGMGFVWERAIGTRALPPLPGNGSSRALGINNHGQIVGWSKSTGVSDHAPTLWDGDDVINLGTIGTQHAQARDINDLGQATGQVGSAPKGPSVVWENGTIKEIGSLSGGKWGSSGIDINELGDVTGNSPVKGPGNFLLVSRPFLFTAAGTLHNLRTLPCGPFEAAFGSGHGINDHRQIVGMLGCVTSPPTLGDQVAAIWEQGIGWRNLNELIPPGSGWELYYATGINNRGQIIGSGFLNGENRAYLLTPDPAPMPTWQVREETNAVGFIQEPRFVSRHVADRFTQAILAETSMQPSNDGLTDSAFPRSESPPRLGLSGYESENLSPIDGHCFLPE